MHIADIEAGIIGANGIVGAGMPLAVGAALGSKMQDSGAVSVAFFGDGDAAGHRDDLVGMGDRPGFGPMDRWRRVFDVASDRASCGPCR